MKIKKFIIICFIFSTLTVEAKNFDGKSFELELPSEWESYIDLYGLPHTFLGPLKLNRRPSLGVIPSGNKEIVLTGKPDQATVTTFYKNKSEWIEEHQGKLIKHFPYEHISSPKISNIHRFGSQYKLGKDNFIEYSYYFHCGKELFHVKSLALLSDDAGLKTLSGIVNSIGCKP